MRDDVLVKEVLAKCEALKQAGFWPPEPQIRPRAWINNFEKEDRAIAAYLLDKFSFYNKKLTDALFVASYNSIGDGLPKGPTAPSTDTLITALDNAVFTPVTGEDPNPTDSGNLFCRNARQVLRIPEQRIVSPGKAAELAINGRTVVFLDDFIGSGDQFIKTWNRNYTAARGCSFSSISQYSDFAAIYLTLVTTDYGLSNIQRKAPSVAVCATHTLDASSTISGLDITQQQRLCIENFLEKYAPRLRPKESYMSRNPKWLRYGYKERGLLLGFEHSVPDATLPIFWSAGPADWEPLIERA